MQYLSIGLRSSGTLFHAALRARISRVGFSLETVSTGGINARL